VCYILLQEVTKGMSHSWAPVPLSAGSGVYQVARWHQPHPGLGELQVGLKACCGPRQAADGLLPPSPGAGSRHALLRFHGAVGARGGHGSALLVWAHRQLVEGVVRSVAGCSSLWAVPWQHQYLACMSCPSMG
jgi:hypothetical protein